MSRNKGSRLLMAIWIFLSAILLLINAYGIVNLMVSQKYTPSADIDLSIRTLTEFCAYILINMIVLAVVIYFDRKGRNT